MVIRTCMFIQIEISVGEPQLGAGSQAFLEGGGAKSWEPLKKSTGSPTLVKTLEPGRRELGLFIGRQRR